MSDCPIFIDIDAFDATPRWRRRVFFWGPQWFFSWPIKFTFGHDEFNWKNVGMITWAGSVFIRTRRCTEPACVALAQIYRHEGAVLDERPPLLTDDQVAILRKISDAKFEEEREASS